MLASEMYQGVVKWFKDAFGFVTVLAATGDSDDLLVGKDVFVHVSELRPESHRAACTLVAGEYVSFDVTRSTKGLQAEGVRGVLGGSLLCDKHSVLALRSLGQPGRQ